MKKENNKMKFDITTSDFIQTVPTKDVVLKDEGDFISAIFQTDKAKTTLKNSTLNKYATGYNVEIDVTGKKSMIAWLVSHDLSWEDF